MKKSIFYHAGCPVCVTAETELIHLLDADKLEVVHLGEQKSRLPEALELGVKSVPALITPGNSVLHINFGAAIEDLLN